MKNIKIKKIVFSLLFLIAAVGFSSAQEIRLNGYSAYAFDDKIDSYYDASNYYNGKIKGGYQWGAGIEYLVSSDKGVEIKYLRQATTAPMEYYKNGIQYTNFDAAINYLLVGGNNYFNIDNDKVEPYAGAELGMAIINLVNPDSNKKVNATKFAWGLKVGTNIWLNDKVGLKLQAEMISAVQSAGGSFYFGGGGPGVGVGAYSSMYQFGLGGGLTFRMGR
jgi:hypothetical protein